MTNKFMKLMMMVVMPSLDKNKSIEKNYVYTTGRNSVGVETTIYPRSSTQTLTQNI